MYVIPHFDELVNSLLRGAERKLMEAAGEAFGISGRTMLDINQGKKQSSPKLLKAISAKTEEDLYGLHPWAAVLKGLEIEGVDLEVPCPRFVLAILYLSDLDSRLHDLRKLPDSFTGLLKETNHVDWISPEEIDRICFDSDDMIKEGLSVARCYTLLLMLAGLEKDLRDLGLDIDWLPYIDPEGRPRKRFLDYVISQSPVTNRQELYSWYSIDQTVEIESAERVIKRIESGSKEMRPETVFNLHTLCKEGPHGDQYPFELLACEIGRLLGNQYREYQAKGLVLSHHESFTTFYQGCDVRFEQMMESRRSDSSWG